MSGPTILVIEDDAVLGPALLQRLRLEGFSPRLATDGAVALRELTTRPPQAVVSDIRLPDMSGEAVFLRMLDEVGLVPTVFMTAHGDIAQAIRLTRLGARDYRTKPVDVDELVALLRQVCAAAPAAGVALGPSLAMRRIAETLDKVAAAPTPVLFTGEVGVGKDVAARALYERAPLAGPFVAVDCAAGLDAVRLFGRDGEGRVVGAVERAEGGLLYMDAVEELAPPLQARLARLVERGLFAPEGGGDRAFSGRIACASRADLRAMALDGRFRADLFYRLAVIEIAIPPLRRRTEDALWLAERMAADAAARLAKPPKPLHDDALAAIAEHDWPGNARELANRIDRALLLGAGAALTADDLFPEREAAPPSTELGSVVEAATRAQIVEALRRANGRRGEAAALLGLSRTTLWKRMREFGLD